MNKLTALKQKLQKEYDRMSDEDGVERARRAALKHDVEILEAVEAALEGVA